MSSTVSLVILGAGGDLTRRLLLPGVASLLAAETRSLELIGSGRREELREEWEGAVAEAFADLPATERPASRFVVADAADPADLRRLLDECTGTPVLYFALAPSVAEQAVDALGELDLPDDLRLALEKPFGSGLESAARLNERIARLVPEERVFRIDHFLGMSTVLALLGLRFANRLFEPVWSAETIERVEVVFDETLGLEGRGRFYDAAGALVDMIQSHLLEVLALAAMERPSRLTESALRDGIAEALGAARLWDGDAARSTRRARYTAGRVGDRDLPSYVDEPDVEHDSDTETLAEVAVALDTPRWRGVPFLLRSGKALGRDRTEVTVRFRPAPALDGLDGEPRSDSVSVDLLSGDVRLRLTTNGHGDPFELEQSTFVAHPGPGQLLPYGEVLRGLLDDDATLSIRGDVAEQCWRIVEPVLDAWRAGTVPLDEYPAGSEGPEGWAARPLAGAADDADDRGSAGGNR